MESMSMPGDVVIDEITNEEQRRAKVDAEHSEGLFSSEPMEPGSLRARQQRLYEYYLQQTQVVSNSTSTSGPHDYFRFVIMDKPNITWAEAKSMLLEILPAKRVSNASYHKVRRMLVRKFPGHFPAKICKEVNKSIKKTKEKPAAKKTKTTHRPPQLNPNVNRILIAATEMAKTIDKIKTSLPATADKQFILSLVKHYYDNK